MDFKQQPNKGTKRLLYVCMECITFASYRCLQTVVYSAVYVCICTCYVYKKKQNTQNVFAYI